MTQKCISKTMSMILKKIDYVKDSFSVKNDKISYIFGKLESRLHRFYKSIPFTLM